MDLRVAHAVRHPAPRHDDPGVARAPRKQALLLAGTRDAPTASMRSNARTVLATAATALALQGASAAAQPTVSPRRVFAARAETYAGFVVGLGGGLSAGVAAFAQYGIFQVGCFYEATANGLFGPKPHYMAAGGVAGLRLARGVARFDVLATVGSRQYGNIGADSTGGVLHSVLYADGVGGSTVLLGLRGGVSAEWGRVVRFSVGGRLSLESDLSREERLHTVYTYPNGPPGICLWDCSREIAEHPTVTRQESVTLGGFQVGVMLVLGLRVGGDDRPR